MTGDELHERRRRRLDRERVLRTLTFWLRPEFVLRVVNRFQKVAGFDRSIALASSALTATIPLAILTSAVSSQLGGKGTADRIIERYDLSGGGAEAVKDIFSPASGTSTSLGVVGLLFLLVAVLSFTRAVQRLFEQTWELSSAERPQHVQRPAVDRRAHRVSRAHRPAACRAGAQPSRPHGDAARRAPGRALPGLDRLGAQRQADQARGAGPVRARRLGVARVVLGGRGGLPAAPLQHVLHPLRRDRGGLRHDLGPLLRHGRLRRIGGGRARDPR